MSEVGEVVLTETITDQEIRLHFEIEQFLYREADLLDDRKYEAWLGLFTEDARYWMPMRRNVSSEELEHEFTAERHEMAWFDETKGTLVDRVKQIRTGVHWAEEPFSRISHVVSNVRILEAGAEEVRVRCRFIVYRNRMVEEQSLFVGSRIDTLRRAGRSWQIARREIYLDQSVMLSKNFTNFF
ncbi:MAG: 3-phenylpropionate/cinnamic acid dioxygenase subunit beta [Chloroflexi bacterium]|nr:3-phenylpropionate/cinnamic acid dioxygenase subunit beta [Chloroflexota bacterium]